MYIISIANQKGGCGKTTTAINLSACLATSGKRTLLIDLDPQSHATIGVNSQQIEFPKTIADALMDPGVVDTSLALLTQPVAENFDMIPSDTVLVYVEQELVSTRQRHEQLFKCLKEMTNHENGVYDYLIIDCPPNIGVLTENALYACDEVLLTIETSFLAMHGITRVLDFIQKNKDNRIKPLQLRALATMYDRRKNIAKETLQSIKSHFGDLLYQTVIRINSKLEEAASFGLPITAYSKKCTGYEDYMALADEVLANLGDS